MPAPLEAGRLEAGRSAALTSLDPILFAQRLAGRGAVDVSDDDLLGISKLLGELVPVRLHRLAVASPRRQELDEGRLASERTVPVAHVQLQRAMRGRNSAHCHEQPQRRHTTYHVGFRWLLSRFSPKKGE